MQTSCLSALFSVVDTELKNFGPEEAPQTSSAPGYVPGGHLSAFPAVRPQQHARLATFASRTSRRRAAPAQQTDNTGPKEVSSQAHRAAALPLQPTRASKRARRPSQRVRASSSPEPPPRRATSCAAQQPSAAQSAKQQQQQQNRITVGAVTSSCAAAGYQPLVNGFVPAFQPSGSPEGDSSASSDSDKSQGTQLAYPIFVSNRALQMDAQGMVKLESSSNGHPDTSSIATAAPQHGHVAAGVPIAQGVPVSVAPQDAVGQQQQHGLPQPDMQGVAGHQVVAPQPLVPGGLMAVQPGATVAGTVAAAGGASSEPATGMPVPVTLPGMMPHQAGFYNFSNLIPMHGTVPGQPYQGAFFTAPGMMLPGVGQHQMGGQIFATSADMGAAAATGVMMGGGHASNSSPPASSQQPPAKRARQTASGFASKHPGTSNYRGVSWHTQTGRWKAQIKVNGRDINLGRHKDEMAAAKAYDRAAICARGVDNAKLNFPVEDYQDEVADLSATPLDDLAASLRGVEERMQAQTSRYHGVRLNKRTKKWEAYIRVNGKHVHLGCYDHEVAAAQAFDQAAIVRHAYNLGAMGGKPHLVTNFPPEYYQNLLQSQQSGGASGVVADGVAAAAAAGASEAGGHLQGTIGTEGHCFYKLEEKYVQNLVEKCREQGGQVSGEAGPASGLLEQHAGGQGQADAAPAGPSDGLA